MVRPLPHAHSSVSLFVASLPQSVEELLNVSLGTEDSSDDEEYLPEGAEHSEGAGHSDSEGVGHSDSDSEDPGCTEDTERGTNTTYL